LSHKNTLYCSNTEMLQVRYWSSDLDSHLASLILLTAIVTRLTIRSFAEW